jgi:hypothetical protein
MRVDAPMTSAKASRRSATEALSEPSVSPKTTMPAAIASALPTIAVTAITGTAGPSCSERAEAKNATTPPAIIA